MAEEHVAEFGLSGWGTVWSVDDAWFEGSNPNKGDRALPIAEEISFDECGRDYQKLLDALARRWEEREDLGEVLLGDEFNYLKVLAQLCEEHHLYLRLCNFEYFETHYQTEINEEKSIILLDINYADFQRADKMSPVAKEQYSAENYGYLLLADLMKGELPRARTMFLTSFETLAKGVEDRHQAMSDWIPFKYIPSMSKSSDSTSKVSREDQLRAFIKNFKRRVEKDPLREFSNALLRAQSFPHPAPDIAAKVPPDFLLRAAFMVDGGQEEECESFKALYMLDQKSGGKSGRDLLTRVFTRHLEYAGVEVDVSGAETFRLPVEPGMLFILCLIDFHKELNLDAPIQLELSNRGATGSAMMTIPLNDHEEFRSTFLTREAEHGAVSALRRLLGCKPTVFENSVDETSGEFASFVERCTQNRMTSNGRHYKLMMEPSFNKHGLTITWEYACSPEDF